MTPFRRKRIASRIPERLGGPAPEVTSTRSRRRLIAAVVAAGVVLAVTVATFVIVNVGTDQGSRNAAGPSLPTTTARFSAAQIATWQWQNIPNAPIVGRSSAAAAWTGKEMLIWGGANTTLAPTQVLYGDGVAYNPTAKTWRTLPAAPLSPCTRTASVWTGTQLFVWGGYVSDSVATDDGALYDPNTERWQKLPSSPLSPRVDVQAIWTGREVIVVGGAPAIVTDASHAFVDAATYNPTTNTWRRLPPIPQTTDHDTQMITSVWIGTRLLVWDSWSHAQSTGSTTQLASGIDLLEYRPATHRWHRVQSAGSPAGVANPIWTGTEVITPATQAYCGGCSEPAPIGLHAERATTPPPVRGGTWPTVPSTTPAAPQLGPAAR